MAIRNRVGHQSAVVQAVLFLISTLPAEKRALWARILRESSESSVGRIKNDFLYVAQDLEHNTSELERRRALKEKVELLPMARFTETKEEEAIVELEQEDPEFLGNALDGLLGKYEVQGPEDPLKPACKQLAKRLADDLVKLSIEEISIPPKNAIHKVMANGKARYVVAIANHTLPVGSRGIHDTWGLLAERRDSPWRLAMHTSFDGKGANKRVVCVRIYPLEKDMPFRFYISRKDGVDVKDGLWRGVLKDGKWVGPISREEYDALSDDFEEAFPEL